MTAITIEKFAGKMNRVGYDAFLQSLRHAKNEGNRNVELSHWLFHIVQNPKSDISATLNHFKLDRAKLTKDLGTLAWVRNILVPFSSYSTLAVRPSTSISNWRELLSLINGMRLRSVMAIGFGSTATESVQVPV